MLKRPDTSDASSLEPRMIHAPLPKYAAQLDIRDGQAVFQMA